MAVIQRSKSTVFGLNADLNNIKTAGGFGSNLEYLSIPTANYVAGATSVRHATELLDSKLKEIADSVSIDGSTFQESINTINTNIGDTSTLTTTSKVVVGALNELDGEIGDTSTLTTTSKVVVGALNELDADKMDKSANLSDVADVATARTNLDVYSTTEVQNAIKAANLALGTNHDVTTIAARDALTGLDVADKVFVADDGDGKWALYRVSAVDGNGSVTTWVKLMDQDALEISISKESVKATYESNPDTNAYTDTEKVKVGFVSITSARDLDKLIQSDELNTSITLANAANDDIASSLAVKTYVDNEAAKLLEISNNLSDVADTVVARTNLDVYSKAETDNAITNGGALFRTESLTVVADQVTLTYAPKNGVIFNFTCVRHTDANGVSFDIPTTPTADPKVFNIHPDASGDFDTKSVTVQYAHVAV